MKTTCILLFFAFAAQMVFGQNNEDENIKKIIRAETDNYFKNDAEGWQSTWLHSDKISATYVSKDNYNTTSGWNNFGPDVMKYMQSNPAITLINLKNDSFKITNNGNMAWVEYKQIVTYKGRDSNITMPSDEYRVLVKENNDWKILSLISYNKRIIDATAPQEIENSLNTTGYNLMTANRLNDAIEVFKLNVKLHPKAWNPYDSLGEAYALAGKKKEAIENYEMSIKLNPKNDNGVKALQKLRTK